MLQVGSKTQLMLCQLGILPFSHRHLSISEGIFKVYILIYAYWLLGCSIYEKNFAFMHKWQSAILHSSAQPTEGSIYTLSSTDDCFIVSQLFSVAKHTRCFKLGLKPGWFYISQISYSSAIITENKSDGMKMFRNEKTQGLQWMIFLFWLFANFKSFGL